MFDDNVPAFFTSDEHPDFVGFLTSYAPAWNYKVIERAGEVMACAGYAVSADGTTANLCWGMVHPNLHRQGLGTLLLKAWLEALRLTPGIEQVVMDTSQHAQAFYVRFGVELRQVVPNGYGPGLDRCEMALGLRPLA